MCLDSSGSRLEQLAQYCGHANESCGSIERVDWLGKIF